MIPGHKIEVRGSENNANIVFYQTNPANSYKTNGIRHFYPSQTPPVSTPKSPRFHPFTPPFYPLFEPANQPFRPPRNHPSDRLKWSVFAPDSRQSGGTPSLRSLQLLDLINVDR